MQGKDTKYGKAAREADKCVQGLIRLISWAQEAHGADWAMENPRGSLRAQWYMRRKVIRQAKCCTVCFCVWGHYYKKPTNIWTSLAEWDPLGPERTGAVFDGMCHRDCKMGQWGFTATGRRSFTHFQALAAGSSRTTGGKGRRVGKATVPGGLHADILAAWRGKQ